MKKWQEIKQWYKILKLKRLCYCPAYFAGSEIHRLLDYDVLKKLVKKIKPGNVILASTLLFGKTKISAEEQFLYILNKYVVFVKSHCFINPNEVVLIVEETLKSKYSEVLFSKIDFHINGTPEKFHLEFKRMFLDSLFENYKLYFCKEYPNHPLSYLKELSLDNEEDVNILFSVFRSIINLKRTNLYYFFIKDLHKKSSNDQCLYQIQWKNLIRRYTKEKEHLDSLEL